MIHRYWSHRLARVLAIMAMGSLLSGPLPVLGESQDLEGVSNEVGEALAEALLGWLPERLDSPPGGLRCYRWFSVVADHGRHPVPDPIHLEERDGVDGDDGGSGRIGGSGHPNLGVSTRPRGTQPV